MRAEQPHPFLSYPVISGITSVEWSEWRELNSRSLAPKASAIPLGYTQIIARYRRAFHPRRSVGGLRPEEEGLTNPVM